MPACQQRISVLPETAYTVKKPPDPEKKQVLLPDSFQEVV